jgi:hypothetical protein
MPIVEDTLSGRLDKYKVYLYDSNDFSRSKIDVNLAGDINIRYGKLERSPSKSILPSYCQLTFVDEGLELFDEFRGGFSRERYVVEIVSTSTDDVNWRGLVKEKTRIVPFSTRTSKETTTLNCYGGIVEGRISEEKALEKHGGVPNDIDLPMRGAYQLSRVTKQIPIRSIGNNGSFDGGEIIDSELSLKETFGSNTSFLKVGSIYDFDIPASEVRWFPAPLNTFYLDASTLYDLVKEFNKTFKYTLYRSLSEGKIVWQERFKVGVGERSVKSTQNWPNKDDYTTSPRSSYINTLKTEDLIVERDEDGLRDIRAIGDIDIIFDKSENLLHLGQRGSTDISSTSAEYDDDNNTIGNGRFVSREKETMITIGNSDDSTNNIITFFMGEFNPIQPIRIYVDWESPRNVNNIEIEYINSSNDVVSESNLQDNSDLVGPTTNEKVSPQIKVDLQKAQGDPVLASQLKLRARIMTAEQDIVETLVASSDDKGIEPVEIEYPIDGTLIYYANDNNNNSIFDNHKVREPLEIKNTVLGIRERNSHFYQESIESLYRPPGTTTARFKTVGIYGPEYVHKIEDENGDIGYYVATGINISLREGTSDLSLVEIPPHELS